MATTTAGKALLGRMERARGSLDGSLPNALLDWMQCVEEQLVEVTPEPVEPLDPDGRVGVLLPDGRRLDGEVLVVAGGAEPVEGGETVQFLLRVPEGVPRSRVAAVLLRLAD